MYGAHLILSTAPAEISITTDALQLMVHDQDKDIYFILGGFPLYTIIQCATVMAIYCTDYASRNRRLGNIGVAKQYYYYAIQLHKYVHQLSINMNINP